MINLIFKRGFAYALFGFFLLAWLYAASLPLQSRLLKYYTAQNDTRYETSLVDWPHLNHVWKIDDNINSAIKNHSLDVKLANEKKISLWQHAVRARPLFPYSWIYLSEAYHRNHEQSKSVQALNFAEQVSWQRADFLKPVLGQYLRLGKIDEAKRVAKRLITIDLRETPTVYSLLSQFISDDVFINEIIPMKSLSQRYARGQIVDRSRYLTDLIKSIPIENQDSMISTAWAVTSSGRKSQLVLAISSYLEQTKRYKLRNMLLVDTGSPVISSHNPVYLDFTGDSPLCWQKSPWPYGGADYKVDEAQSPPPLTVLLKQVWQWTFSHLNCYLPVDIDEPAELSLKGSWSGKGFDSTTTPINYRFTVYNQNTSSVRHSKLITQEGEWSNLPLSLSINLTPDDIGIKITFIKSAATKFRYIPGEQQFTIHQAYTTLNKIDKLP